MEGNNCEVLLLKKTRDTPTVGLRSRRVLFGPLGPKTQTSRKHCNLHLHIIYYMYGLHAERAAPPPKSSENLAARLSSLLLPTLEHLREGLPRAALRQNLVLHQRVFPPVPPELVRLGLRVARGLVFLAVEV